MKTTLFTKQLSDYFTTYLPNNKKCSQHTIAAYADGFVTLFQFFENQKSKHHYSINYSDINAKSLDEYILWMQNVKNYSEASQKQRISALASFLKYASSREMKALSAYLAVAEVKTPKVPKVCSPYFSTEEIKVILRMPKHTGKSGYRDTTLLALLYDSGARAQEICDIKICDITIGKTSTVMLHGKGNKNREVPISPDVSKIINKYLTERRKSKSSNYNEYLFQSQRADHITPACIRNLVDKYVHAAKAENPTLFKEKNYSPHSFRHSKAIHLLEAGIPLIYIRNFLGHESVQTTEIYLRMHQNSVSNILRERNACTELPQNEDTDNSGKLRPDFLKIH